MDVVAEVTARLKCLAKRGHGEDESQTSELSGAGGCRERRAGEAGLSVAKGFTHVKKFGLDPDGEPLRGSCSVILAKVLTPYGLGFVVV